MDKKHILVFGYNRLSYDLANNLDEKQHRLKFADVDEDNVRQASENGFTAAVMDYRSDENLSKLGIGQDVETLFCFLPEDSENVFLTISARALDKNLEIISIVEDPDCADKLLAAGANKIINPYEISGRKIFQLVTKPDITTVLDQTVFGRHDLNMAEVKIPENSQLENTFASQLALHNSNNLILVGVVDRELGDDLFFSMEEEDHKLDAGDILVVLGPTREIRAFKKEIEKQNYET